MEDQAVRGTAGARALEEAAPRLEELITKLRTHGFRMTPQRMGVLRALVESTDHPSAEQIYRRLEATYPMLSPATVYKTIDTLKSMGEILELEFRDGANRYDANIPTPHPHLVCTNCRRLEDLHLQELANLGGMVAANTDYSVIYQRVEFYGLCPECQAVLSGPPGEG